MTTIETYTDVEQFAALAVPALGEHEPENNLPLGVLANVRSGDYRDEPPLLAIARRDAEVAAVAIRTPPYKMLLSYMPAPEDDLIDALARAALDRYGDELPGVTADSAVASAFADAITRHSGRNVHIADRMRIYALTHVVEADRAAGTLRHAAEADRELATGWITAFHNEVAAMHDISPEKADDLFHGFVTAPDAERGLVLFEREDIPVSMAGYSGSTPNGIRVVLVYTPPELRGHGYASAAVAELSRRLLAGGRRFCFLFTELSNPTSNHIYQEIGYRPVSDVDSWSFGER
ncbi:MAG: GNAT family N-acetyltransferase [Spirochaetota bacterium]